MTSPGPQRQTPPAASAPKSSWRVWARETRGGVDASLIGRMISERLQDWPVYMGARHVLTYLAFDGEPDLAPLLSDANKTFYTTRTGDQSLSREPAQEGARAGGARKLPPPLTLHLLEPGALERHRFGYLQPSALAPTVDPALIDLVLVPGLAFDLTGNRLGFGMGFYDRLLPGIDASVPRVGVTASRLLVERLPSEPHDVRMTHLVTEDGLLTAGGQAS